MLIRISKPVRPHANPTLDRALTGLWYPPLKIATLTQVLLSQGHPLQEILQSTDLSWEKLHNRSTRTSIQQWLTVARNGLRLNGHASHDLGIKTGLAINAAAYGMYGYMLQTARTLQDTFELSKRYHSLATPVLEQTWQLDGDEVIWQLPCWEEVRSLTPEWQLYQMLVDIQLLTQHALAQQIMGQWCVPSRITLYGNTTPEHLARLSAAMGCPVTQGASRTTLRYPAEWLLRNSTREIPQHASQLSPSCARLLQEFQWHNGFSQKVYDELTCIPGRFPDIDTIATGFGMTSRTLRRKLDAEGTSYSELLARVRHALAMDALTTTLLTTEDIAAALDFSDAASFRQAFKRWTGKTPQEFRH